jgi:hypothetical protein
LTAKQLQIDDISKLYQDLQLEYTIYKQSGLMKQNQELQTFKQLDTELIAKLKSNIVSNKSKFNKNLKKVTKN